ncbi:hypothetical protein KUTeg_024110 [Tegillarca granosa]|uniref:Thioredoxin domain-containing protein 9 n=1 Tax=Tegillarca granosa TaxID=220873 RepID=A0ABQ9DWZ3_TEGGR|nr:hypothetical protein KUTeg_024110 [Tegillarca granosa]
MEKALEAHLMQATQMIEQQVDAEIEKLDKMEDDDYEKLRQRRMDAMKKSQQQKQDWLAAGHGHYFEIASEKEFFDECKKKKCPFLVERLKIKILPTICLAKDGKTVDYIVGFADLGNVDDFPTEMMEWRLGRADIINYEGDLVNPPTVGGNKKSGVLGYGQPKKTIRSGDDDSSDDNDDW